MYFDIEKTKRTIQKNIAYKAEDTFLNHLKTFWKSDGKLTGIVSDDGFKIWASHWYLGGIVHVIADGRFINQKVVIRTRINIVGKIFILLFLLFWTPATFFFIFYRDSSWIFSFAFVVSWLLLQAMIIVPMLAGYYLERKNIIAKVEKMINNA